MLNGDRRVTEEFEVKTKAQKLENLKLEAQKLFIMQKNISAGFSRLEVIEMTKNRNLKLANYVK